MSEVKKTDPGIRHRRTRRFLRGVALVVLVAVAVVAAGFTIVPSGRAAVRAGLLLPALVTAQEPPALALLGEPISHTRATISGGQEPVFLDIFAPKAAPPPIPGAREGVLVIAGVGENWETEQYLNLMRSMAQAGIVAVAMSTPTLQDYQLSPDQADAIVVAYQAMVRMPGVSEARSGILGFSAGGSIASIAAADPRIRDHLRFVTAFGAYYDAKTLLADVGWRAIIVDGKEVPWQPSLVTVQVLANSVADTLPPGDARTLKDAVAANAKSLTPDQIAALSPAGQAMYHLLAGDQRNRVSENIAALPPEAHRLLGELSPATIIPRLRAPIYLLHDRNDIFVPYTQSRTFAAALDSAGKTHEFVEFSIFQHVEVRSGLGFSQLLGDAVSLFRVLTLLLLPSC